LKAAVQVPTTTTTTTTTTRSMRMRWCGERLHYSTISNQAKTTTANCINQQLQLIFTIFLMVVLTLLLANAQTN
jgi:hypothetical protein